MSEENKIAKVRIIAIQETYENGNYLAIVEELPISASAIFRTKIDATSRILVANGVWDDGPVIPKGTEMELLDCNLHEEKSPYKYEFVDEHGKLVQSHIYLYNESMEYVSGSLGRRFNDPKP